MSTVAQTTQKSQIEYSCSDQAWLVGLPSGQIITHPAGPAGKLAAQLSALTHDRPGIAAEVDALIQAWPNRADIHRRLIRAGFIIRDSEIYRHPGNFFRVQSQAEPQRFYAVGLPQMPGGEAGCTCPDHVDGHAPHLPDLGPNTCKHILAAYIAERVDPWADCPICHGLGSLASYPTDNTWPETEPCPACDGCGLIPLAVLEEFAQAHPEPPEEKPCYDCEGSGEVVDVHGPGMYEAHRCLACNGTGRHPTYTAGSLEEAESILNEILADASVSLEELRRLQDEEIPF